MVRVGVERAAGMQLYDMTRDGTEPHTNVAGQTQFQSVQSELQALLHQGPPPSGWGPYVHHTS
jgi:hypothetical protein